MNIKYFFNTANKVNSRLIRNHKEYIESNFGKDIEHLNPSLSQRLKYELFKPAKKLCSCGKDLKLSPNASEIFKQTCGSFKCVGFLKSNEKQIKFKETIKIRSMRNIKNFSKYEEKEHILNRIKTVVKPNYFCSEQKDINLHIKRAASNLGMKLTQYCYHLIKEDFEIPKCDHGKKLSFYSFEQGYSKTNSCCLVSAKIRQENKIQEKILEMNSDFIVIDSYPINEKPWKIKSNKCGHIFEKWVKDGFNMNHIFCPQCRPTNKSSHEFKIIEEIKKIYTGEIIHGDRKIIALRELDIYIPEFKLGIEVNGVYWHKDDKNRHLDKYLECSKRNIKLIQFTDIDIYEKLDVVISMIRSSLKLNNRIFAKNCKIEKITSQEYSAFVNNNHIKKSANAKIKLGLFHNNELVSIFSIGKNRFEEGYELIRFCSKLNTTVVGALSKFISYMKRNYIIDQLITYADIHYGDGKSYLKTGFTFQKRTIPNYFYFKGSEVRSRQYFQKKRLKNLLPEYYDEKLSEKQIMENAGYRRYYDCGNNKYSMLFKT